MTFVRHNRLTIIRQPSVDQRTQTRLRNKTRLRNRGSLGDLVCGRVDLRALRRIPLFLSRRCKSTASRLAASLYIAADVDNRRRAFANQHITMRERNDDTTTNAQLFNLHPRSQPVHDLPKHLEPFDAFDGWNSQPSNEKSGDSEGELTRLTDLTVIEMGVYVAGTHPRPRSRPPTLAALPTPSFSAVKSVKSVKPQDGEGGFSPPCRQTGCQFDGSAGSGVVA